MFKVVLPKASCSADRIWNLTVTRAAQRLYQDYIICPELIKNVWCHICELGGAVNFLIGAYEDLKNILEMNRSSIITVSITPYSLMGI